MPENSQPRALSLDALRGFAILTMVLSGVVPYGVLPAWMYHAQVPPPLHKFDPNLPGITWVDLVFPFFLFALGAAIPLALNKRLEKGASRPVVALQIFERTLLLGFFALIHRAFSPWVINPETNRLTWTLGLLGFAVMFVIFLRPPDSWGQNLRRIIKLAGWAGALLLLIFLRYPDGSGFSLYRSNIILIVLTNTYFFGALIWLFTRENLVLRLSVLGLLMALRLSYPVVGWVQTIWNWSPISWLYKLYYCQYLFIVIPGTIVGEMFLKRSLWKPDNSLTEDRHFQDRMILLTTLMLLFTPIMLVGLKLRLVTETALLSLTLLGLTGLILTKGATTAEKFLRTLFIWGAYWLVLGLLFEPFEGGIKKDHPTLSYYFITDGLAIFLVIAFAIIIDIYRKPWLRLFILNGQNPMLAYSAMANFIMPILSLTTLHELFIRYTHAPWLGALRAAIYTLLLALGVAYCTKKKWYWRT